MIRARPVTFAGGLLLEDAPVEQKESRSRGKKEGRRERCIGTGQGRKKVEVMIKSWKEVQPVKDSPLNTSQFAMLCPRDAKYYVDAFTQVVHPEHLEETFTILPTRSL